MSPTSIIARISWSRVTWLSSYSARRWAIGVPRGRTPILQVVLDRVDRDLGPLAELGNPHRGGNPSPPRRASATRRAGPRRPGPPGRASGRAAARAVPADRTDTAAITLPEGERTGAETDATPCSRSPTDCDQPRRRMPASAVAQYAAFCRPRCIRSGSSQASRICAAEPARMVSWEPTGSCRRRPVGALRGGDADAVLALLLPQLRGLAGDVAEPGQHRSGRGPGGHRGRIDSGEGQIAVARRNRRGRQRQRRIAGNAKRLECGLTIRAKRQPGDFARREPRRPIGQQRHAMRNIYSPILPVARGKQAVLVSDVTGGIGSIMTVGWPLSSAAR